MKSLTGIRVRDGRAAAGGLGFRVPRPGLHLIHLDFGRIVSEHIFILETSTKFHQIITDDHQYYKMITST
jgi:hypothetical protein